MEGPSEPKTQESSVLSLQSSVLSQNGELATIHLAAGSHNYADRTGVGDPVEDTQPSLRIALAVVGGIIIVILVVLIVVLFGAGGGLTAAVTEVTGVPTTTTTAAVATTTSTAAATTTTTTAPTTTTTSTSTTAPSTTSTFGATVDPSGFDTATKAGVASGDPGVGLTDVRVGDHSTFARIVFDFEGEGIPEYVVGYTEGPGFTGSGGGDPVFPAGSFYLVVRITPGLTYDVDDRSPIYLGPSAFDPALDPIAEIAFVDDFEADMVWVIGLDSESGFQVSIRTEPPRLVIDIAK